MLSAGYIIDSRGAIKENEDSTRIGYQAKALRLVIEVCADLVLFKATFKQITAMKNTFIRSHRFLIEGTDTDLRFLYQLLIHR